MRPQQGSPKPARRLGRPIRSIPMPWPSADTLRKPWLKSPMPKTIRRTAKSITARQNAYLEEPYGSTLRMWERSMAWAMCAMPRGDLDGAIGAYRQAIEIAPNYTSAHHDLAIAYEGKWRADPAQAQQWCALALQAWRTAYELAPDDPSFSSDSVVRIGQHIRWLKSQCGEDWNLPTR